MVGSRVLNKVELHFDNLGLCVAVATQGLFTLAPARPILTLAWPEITALAVTTSGPRQLTAKRLARATVNVLTMRLDLPDRLAIGTPGWTMTVGVRVAAGQLAELLRELIAGLTGPAPAVTADLGR
jgi:hypothetical protein